MLRVRQNGVFQNAIEEVHSLKHTSGCEGDKRVAIDVEDIDDEIPSIKF